MKHRILVAAATTVTILAIAVGTAVATHNTPNVAQQYDEVGIVADPTIRKIIIPLDVVNKGKRARVVLPTGETIRIGKVRKILRKSVVTLIDADGTKCAMRHKENVKLSLSMSGVLKIKIIKNTCSPGWGGTNKSFDFASSKLYDTKYVYTQLSDD